MNKRLTKAREYLGLTKTNFAHELGLKSFNIRDMESGKQKISAELATKLEEIFSISGWWLLTGKGNMLQNDGENLPKVSNKSLSKNTVGIKYYPEVYAAAGYGAINEETKPQIMNFDRNFIEQFLNVRKIEKLDIIRIIGDSMEPFIHNGELVMLERDTEARNGETVIANINGQVYVKRFQADPFKKWIKLVSDNEIYGDISLDSTEEIQALTIIGIVRARIKQF